RASPRTRRRTMLVGRRRVSARSPAVSMITAGAPSATMERVRVLRTLALIIAILVGLAAGSALYVTQPVYTAVRNLSTGGVVAPGKLEAHVRMLSVTLAPRDWQSAANLDRVATY